MEVTQAIKERMSTRVFKSDPVPMDILKQIVEQSLRAPSWANTQPWEFAIVTGKPLEEIKQGCVARRAQKPNPEIARPYEFPEPFISRIRGLSATDRTHTQDKDFRRIHNCMNHGAPAVIYVLIDRSFYYQSGGINAWSLYDCGSVVQNILLLATNYGLSTVVQAEAAAYPEVVRKTVAIPESKLIAVGVAIGYPDWNDPVNQSRSAREPLGAITSWYGFG